MSTIQQVSSGRFLDAHEIGELDFRVVTRPQQDNDTQFWRIQDFGGGFISIQQVSSGRFLEATLDGDFYVVTRPAGQQRTDLADRRRRRDLSVGFELLFEA